MHKRCGGVSMIGGYEHLRWLNGDSNVNTFLNKQNIFREILCFVSTLVYIWDMKQLRRDTTTMVRIDKKLVGKVAKLRDKGGSPIGKFFELAAEEKLKRDTK